jgi:acyl-CoA synthetase (AMP-forming)/AMP-acid ligase II
LDWNFADVWEVVAAQLPDAPALVHGDRSIDWRTFDAHAGGVAAALLAAGLGPQEKFAQYLRNGPEYLESVFAAWKAALVPVNTNYRYREDEIVSLWDNADVAAVVFHGSFTELADRARHRLPSVRLWLWVDDGTVPCPGWATPYDTAAALPGGATPDRSGDDLWLVYTGGTTGAPKGVMWRQDDLLRVLNGRAAVPLPLDADLDAVRGLIRQPGPVALIVSPLMHAAAAVRAFPVLNSGGCVITLPAQTFDAVDVLDAITKHRVNSLAIVGDAFARPIVDALDNEPTRWDLSSLRTISSSGALFSETVIRGLLHHNEAMQVIDVVGASEAMGVAFATWTVDSTFEAGRFVPSPDTLVLEDGRLARRGNIPLGYYKDPDRSATTFPVIDGERWSVPGPYGMTEPDGSLRLIGRGTSLIYTAGEKVWPEEVEAVVKELPGVLDAAVVGVPDDRLGEEVKALVVRKQGVEITEAALVEWCREQFASYKYPRIIEFRDSLPIGATGKILKRELKRL